MCLLLPALTCTSAVRLAVAQAGTSQVQPIPLGVGDGHDGFGHQSESPAGPLAFMTDDEDVLGCTDASLAARMQKQAISGPGAT